MDAEMRVRLVGAVCLLSITGGIAFNWYLLVHDGYFYPKVSGLGPVGAMFSLMSVGFPSMARRRPNRSQKGSIVVSLIVALIGVALGAINLYLMGNYHL